MRFGVYACVRGQSFAPLDSLRVWIRACRANHRSPEFVEERRLIAPGVLFYCSDRYQLWLMGLQEKPSEKVQLLQMEMDVPEVGPQPP